MMKRDDWKAGEFSVRPAGDPDKCFYCGVNLGEQHKAACVIRQRTVVVDVTIRMVRLIPEKWTAEDLEFVMNNGSWCATNIISEIEHLDESNVEYVREATEEDESKYHVFVSNSES